MKFGKILLLFVTLYGSCTFAGTMASESWQPSPWLFRIRAIDVIPSPSSNRINDIFGRVDHMSQQIVPEFDISYFFAPHFAAEAIFGTMRHTVSAHYTSIGRADLGRVALLPPTVTLQYHFAPEKRYRPYAGIGINFTHFYRVSRGPLSQSTFYGQSFGPALQAGIDISIKGNWSLNLDIKKLYIQTNAYVSTAEAQFNPTVKINPYIAGIGIAYRR